MRSLRYAGIPGIVLDDSDERREVTEESTKVDDAGDPLAADVAVDIIAVSSWRGCGRDNPVDSYGPLPESRRGGDELA